MKSRLMISVAAIALIAGAGLANAQGGTKNESGGGATMQQNAPTGGAPATTGREGAGPSQAQSPSEKSPSATKGQRAEEKTPGATKSKSAEEQMPGAKSKSMSSDTETKGNMKAEGKEGRETGKSAAEGREGQTTTNKNAETQSGRSQTTTGQAGAGSGAKLSTEQRTKITTVIRNEHVESVHNVDFDVSVGTRIPRERVHLRPLPSEVVTIYPEWRGYEFILVRNEILVIDPATLQIVAILPA
jgi:hypothetical protein